uniref:Uncharacterized protein n=1 Tax=Spironucleus salmonicida TaxID=348837 RepID=V6LP22_9EUKA|eukprot:EST46350.1 Hypothetical protein SS50377_13665 [Spironucleus salmonicida]
MGICSPENRLKQKMVCRVTVFPLLELWLRTALSRGKKAENTAKYYALKRQDTSHICWKMNLLVSLNSNIFSKCTGSSKKFKNLSTQQHHCKFTDQCQEQIYQPTNKQQQDLQRLNITFC